MSNGECYTGQPDDPALFAALPRINNANVIAWRVQRAKNDLVDLPKLSSPVPYVTARQTAENLQPLALQDAASASSFIAAVAAAKALVP